jgi:hypothetical protein
MILKGADVTTSRQQPTASRQQIAEPCACEQTKTKHSTDRRRMKKATMNQEKSKRGARQK